MRCAVSIPLRNIAQHLLAYIKLTFILDSLRTKATFYNIFAHSHTEPRCIREVSISARILDNWPSSLLSENVKNTIYRIIILPTLLHVCETWSLTLKEESRLSVFEIRVLRRIFGRKRDEVRGGCTCSVHLTKYYSGDQIKKSDKGRTCSTYVEEVRCIQGFSGET